MLLLWRKCFWQWVCGVMVGVCGQVGVMVLIGNNAPECKVFCIWILTSLSTPILTRLLWGVSVGRWGEGECGALGWGRVWGWAGPKTRWNSGCWGSPSEWAPCAATAGARWGAALSSRGCWSLSDAWWEDKVNIRYHGAIQINREIILHKMTHLRNYFF